MAKFTVRSVFLLMAIILIAIGLYQRLWIVQMELSNQRQKSTSYEKIYHESLDEVAYWRKQFDAELVKSDGHLQRLQQMTIGIREAEHKLQVLQEENLKLAEEKQKLLAEVELLKKKLTDEHRKVV